MEANMSDSYIISACSYADMPAERIKELGVKYICTPYMINGAKPQTTKNFINL